MTGATPALRTRLLEHLVGTTAWPLGELWVALFTDALPVYDADTSTAGEEVSGGGYERVQMVSESAQASNSQAIVFTDLPGGVVAGLGLYDAETGGELLLYATYDPPFTLVPGQRFVLGVGSLDLELVMA